MADYRSLGNRYEDIGMIQEFIHNGETIKTVAEPKGDSTEVSISENKFTVAELLPGKYTISVNGVRHTVCCVVDGDKVYADVEGILLELSIPSEDGGTAGGGAGTVGEKDKIFAPMPGKVVKILVSEGVEVKEGQPMVIVEAMKMENQVNAAADGTVKKINFAAGDQVDTETPIIELELAEE